MLQNSSATLHLNKYIKYTPNQDKNVVIETEFVSLVNAETFSYKNVYVQTNIPENGIIIPVTRRVKGYTRFVGK